MSYEDGFTGEEAFSQVLRRLLEKEVQVDRLNEECKRLRREIEAKNEGAAPLTEAFAKAIAHDKPAPVVTETVDELEEQEEDGQPPLFMPDDSEGWDEGNDIAGD